MSDKNLHIAMIIARFSPAVGGTENQCRELSKRLVQKGHRVTVITEQFEPSLAPSEVMDGVEIIRFPRASPSLLNSFTFTRKLMAWVRRNPEVHILHAHMLSGPALAALVAAEWFRKPIIVKVAGAGITGDVETSQTRKRGQLKLYLFHWLKPQVACPSSRTYDELLDIGFPQEKLTLLPNGVDTDRFTPSSALERARFRAALNLDATAPLALYVGRWFPGKGVEDLLAVWEMGKTRKGFAWKLCLVIDRQPTRDQSERLEALGDAVYVFVKPPNVREFYGAADVAMLLSRNEGLSNFLLEAMASGLPVITTEGASASPAPERYTYSWTVKPEETEALVNLLGDLGTHLQTLQNKGQQAREIAARDFSLNQVASTYESLYREALA